jgi:hypothetical protein
VGGSSPKFIRTAHTREDAILATPTRRDARDIPSSELKYAASASTLLAFEAMLAVDPPRTTNPATPSKAPPKKPRTSRRSATVPMACDITLVAGTGFKHLTLRLGRS